MKVFKFGGASIKNVKAIKNMAALVRQYASEPLLIVVSAMGKTTNALEQIVDKAQKNINYKSSLDEVKSYHSEIIHQLEITNPSFLEKIESQFKEIEKSATQVGDYDQVYDQVVSQGEILSSMIVSSFLSKSGLSCEWLDARKYIHTNETYREGKVDWIKSKQSIETLHKTLSQRIIITQGFIGGTSNQTTTTLGREGSDYSAAIFATCLPAKSVTIWKDVPGVMSADPKRISNAIVFEELHYQ
jgi:aspartate kinase